MEDRKQPFAAFVLETVARRSAELGRWWTERARLPVPSDSGERDNHGDGAAAEDVAERLVRTLADAAFDDAHRDDLMRAGWTLGAASHRGSVSLHEMLGELDLLTATLLQAAERAADDYDGSATAGEGIVVARRIAGAASLLRLGATTGYTQTAEDDLRERFRAIRHDLRNPLGTIKSAVALLTDDSVPVELRQNPRVRAMVARNATSLDRMIGEVLGDDAARLHAFGMPPVPADALPDSARAGGKSSGESGGEQRDDVVRSRQRPDLESGAF